MKYKQLKGSADYFLGAPKWATMVVTGGEFSMLWFLESFHPGRQRHIRCVGGNTIFTALEMAQHEYEVIAHREPIQEEKVSVTITNNSTDQLITITERGTRYGKFKGGAEIMQSLKDTMREVDGWNNLTASQKEALDMIQHKIGRILNGDPTYDDSWKDIAGYATLIVNELNGEVK